MSADARRSARHLLIVDDEPVILQILRAVFDGEPYRLTCVATGREALAILEEQGCDVLLTDKNLPDLSGMDLLRAARERLPDCEVIIVTGYASIDTAIEAVGLGAFDYVTKPLDDVFDIKKKVSRALERQEMLRENRRLIGDLERRNEQLERALEDAHTLRSELIQTEKLAGIGTLAAGVAHEVSSPLFGILGLAEAIADADDLAEARSYGSEIVEYSRDIRDIVVELTSYSRATGNDDAGAVEVSPVIDDAVRLVERTVPVEGVGFSVVAPPGLMARAVQGELQQVFVNLLKNAAEAVRERHQGRGGRVRVSARADDAHVISVVEDDGGGIPTDKLGVVFDPFFTTKPPGQGTGLGLNVVYRIVTKMRGTVAVESTPGEGTRFTVRLPLAQTAH
ncbi:MAG: ATP-binding protein [Myxococcota bacterium]|nr:ATP-binding protein [Myxococcota bacterium]